MLFSLAIDDKNDNLSVALKTKREKENSKPKVSSEACPKIKELIYAALSKAG
jgi:hypothetical protein